MPNTNRRPSLPCPPARAWIAVGANLGSPVETVRAAARSVSTLAGTTVEAVSHVRLTAPEGGPAQPRYANAALRVRTSLPPRALLAALAALERQAGRAPARARADAVNHPRPLDLDLLLYDGVVLTTPVLTLPHPRFHLRRFVLDPLCDLDPDLVHPVLGRTLRDLWRALGGRSGDAAGSVLP